MTTAKSAAHEARGSDTFRRVARAGFVVVGLVHIIIGVGAMSIASGGGGDADQDGAMQQIRSTPVGGLVLAVIAAALVALAIWHVVAAFVAVGGEVKKWGQRIKLVGIAIAYLVIAGLAIVYAFGGEVESDETTKTLSAALLSAPGGIFLLVAIGLTVVGVGIGFLVSGITTGFRKLLDLPSGAGRPPIVVLGIIGYVAKGIAVGITGVLFVVAAWTQDADRSGGLDSALRSLTDLPSGRVVLWIVGVGLALYGVFSIVRARVARM